MRTKAEVEVLILAEVKKNPGGISQAEVLRRLDLPQFGRHRTYFKGLVNEGRLRMEKPSSSRSLLYPVKRR